MFKIKTNLCAQEDNLPKLSDSRSEKDIQISVKRIQHKLQNNSTHSSLSHSIKLNRQFIKLRTSYNQTSYDFTQKKRSVESFKFSISGIQQKKKVIKSGINNFVERNNKLQKQQARIELQLSQAKFYTKTLSKMLRCLQHDNLFYKQRNYNYTQIILQQRKQELQLCRQGEQLQSDNQFLLKCMTQAEKNSSDELIKLRTLLAQRYQQLEDNQRKDQQFKKQYIQLQSDSLPYKKMRKIYLAQLFFRKLMKNKVRGSISGNQESQLNFTKIKQSTGLSEPKQLSLRFFSIQNSYNKLLESISFSQRKINQLQSRNKSLVQSLDQLQKESNQLNIAFQQSSQQSLIPLSVKQEKQLNYLMIFNRMVDWTELYLSNLSQVSGRSQLLPRKKQNLQDKIMRLLHFIRKQLSIN